MNTTMKPLNTGEDYRLDKEFRKGNQFYEDGFEDEYDFENDSRLDETTKQKYRREY
jgi:hypothetical protein